MTADEATQLIGQVLATETSAIALSNRLFDQDGLFRWLANTDEERKRLVTTPLFAQAQRRVRELQYAEAAMMGLSVKKARWPTTPENTGERAPSA